MKTENWDKAGHFMDLPDFLTWKATGSLSRYNITLTNSSTSTHTHKNTHISVY